MTIIFLKLKKILMIFILTLIFFEANCHAGRHDESEDESCCSGTLRKLSNVFSCIFEDCFGTSTQYRYEEILGPDLDNEIEELASTESQPISTLPNDVLLYQVAVFLSPPNIISLIKSSKKFSYLRSNDFWQYYNAEYNYLSWHEELPAIKVAFSYYWFRNSKVRKAAVLGFPRAREFIKQQEKLERENPPKPYVRKELNGEFMRHMFIHKKYW